MLTPYSRRRAQNRESQRAYRNRKDSHIRTLEGRLSEVKGKYDKLVADYERCHTEYQKLRKQMDNGLSENERLRESLSSVSHSGRADSEHRSMSYSCDEVGGFDEREIVELEGDSEQVPIP